MPGAGPVRDLAFTPDGSTLHRPRPRRAVTTRCPVRPGDWTPRRGHHGVRSLRGRRTARRMQRGPTVALQPAGAARRAAHAGRMAWGRSHVDDGGKHRSARVRWRGSSMTARCRPRHSPRTARGSRRRRSPAALKYSTRKRGASSLRGAKGVAPASTRPCRARSHLTVR